MCNVKEATAKKLMTLLKENMGHTVTHVNTKRIQAKDFEDDKTDDEARIPQINFAMNYSCEYQNEVQSALWSSGYVVHCRCHVQRQGQNILGLLELM